MKLFLTTHNSQLTTKKAIALITALSLLLQTIVPTQTMASVSGPTQPEFSNFQSVGTSEMVNLFTGDFSYNIPVIDIPGSNGGGYALSLSYHSNTAAEAEPSWVGYGWTLSPGAILRNKQAFADDVNEGNITYYNKMPENWTVSAGASLSTSARAFGALGLSAGTQAVISYNNYKGLVVSTVPYVGYQLGLKTTTISLEDQEWRYSYSYSSPLSVMIGFYSDMQKLANHGFTLKYADKDPPSIASVFQSKAIEMVSGQPTSSNYDAYTLGNRSIPTTESTYDSQEAITLSLGGYYAPSPLPIGFGASIFGSKNSQTTAGEKKYGYESELNDDDTKSYYRGYLYSHNATQYDMMDYNIERKSDFNEHDKILPTPFSSPDLFTVIGEGLNGSFRAYSTKIGEFHPAYSKNFFDVDAVGVHINVGANISGSVSTADGSGQRNEIQAWANQQNDDFDFTSDQSYFFRFIGDMGGHLAMASSDLAETARLAEDKNGDEDHVPSFSESSLYDTINNNEDVGRSSYIGYHTNGEMSNAYQCYSHRSDIEALVNRDNTDRIGEFAITNKDGNKYVYALPVYSANEKSVSVDISTDDDNVGNYLSYQKDDDSGDNRKFGQLISDTIASMYLITEITTPNYIDVDFDGPDKDDIGGWTKFNYTKKCGGNVDANADGVKDENDWYHWRAPWKGLIYQPNQYSDPDDDLGSYSSGDKEIYYLESIETSTHIAEFITSERKDGLEAEDDNDAANNNISLSDNKTLEQLDEIILYAKDANGDNREVIKRVYFEYDYSLALKQPNNINESGSESGKLTLKKVWFEYGDVRNASISPYEFVYEYPTTDYPSAYTYEYDYTDIDTPVCTSKTDIYASYENYGDGLDENPDYDEAAVDCWGNYRADGQARAAKQMDWLDQTPETGLDGASTGYDPAAWKLKQILLPGGAEIHVQYEQKDYAYVQDRRVMAMLPLTSVVANSSSVNEAERNGAQGNYASKYYLDLAEIGADNDEDKKAIKKWIKQIFIDGCDGRKPQKMYFKLLYDVLVDCGEEYITGYTNVMKVDIDDVGLYVQLGNPDANDYNVDGGFSSPCAACQEYYKANKGIDIGQDCGDDAFSGDGEAEEIVLQLIDMLASDYTDNYNQACFSLTPESSYLRIPLASAKIGSGARVKRILTYDKGLESGHADAKLYGTEYVYETTEGECSGVATNEPGAAREENALVAYLNKRSRLTEEEVLVAGEDKSQFEGPVGELLLPSPSIGYSRVVTKNIYSGTTNPGFVTSEFWTCNDYPFDRTSDDDYSGVDKTDITKEVYHPDPHFGLFSNELAYTCWATQGFRFVINNMHGQPKKTTHYEGDYDDINSIHEITELSSTTYNYFDVGESLPVMYSHESFGSLPLGKEVEIITESKKVSEITNDVTATIDAGVANWPATPIVTIPYVLPTYFNNRDETHLYTHLTTKIVYCPAVIKSVTNYKDGIHTTLVNKYFDPNSGDPIVQERSGIYDRQILAGNVAHEGKYISFNFPANMYYPQIGQKAGCELLKIEPGKNDFELKYYYIGPDERKLMFFGDYTDVLAKLSVGDLLAVYLEESCTGTPYIANIIDISNNELTIRPSSLQTSTIHWSGSGECSIQILQSNRANILSMQTGNLLMYGAFDDTDQLSADNIDNILAASASVLSNENDLSDDDEELLNIEADANPVETGQAGKWYVHSAYQYKTDVSNLEDENIDHGYQAGILKDFTFFNWEDTSLNDNSKWLETNTVSLCAPNGKTLEEKNILDIYSAQKYGYNNNLVCLTAANAEYESVTFESFENETECDELLCFDGLSIEDYGITVTSSEAHSGKQSLELSSESIDIEIGGNTQASDWSEINDNGISIKLWCKLSNSESVDINIDGLGIPTIGFDLIAQTGEWKLYEAKITTDNWDTGIYSVSSIYPEITFNYGGTDNPKIYVDDFRIQPLDAQMNCYVYDPETYKLLTQFDDQHFGIYYQYNQEGKLIRQQRETERGMKTIAETQYNLPAESR
jgi:hypothetical protein